MKHSDSMVQLPLFNKPICKNCSSPFHQACNCETCKDTDSPCCDSSPCQEIQCAGCYEEENANEQTDYEYQNRQGY